MTTRELTIIKSLLDELHDQDGRQLGDLQLHAKINDRLELATLPHASLGEINAAFAQVDARGWVIAVPQKFKRGKLRSISEAGEGARLEM